MKSIYIMKASNSYKMGVSSNPEKRVRTLQLGNPNIKLIYISKLLQNAYAIEKMLHKKYCNFALGREWFSLEDENKLIDEVHVLVEEIGISNPSAKSKTETGIDENDVEALIAWIFKPEQEKFQKLCEEIEKISVENSFLLKRLIELGWTQEEIDFLVKNAENSVQC